MLLIPYGQGPWENPGGTENSWPIVDAVDIDPFFLVSNPYSDLYQPFHPYNKSTIGLLGLFFNVQFSLSWNFPHRFSSCIAITILVMPL